MNQDNTEKAILEEQPDFENQYKILEEEHQENRKIRRNYYLIILILFLVAFIFVYSYSAIYYYKPYFYEEGDNCQNVNLKIEDSLVPNLNIALSGCKPDYNIDYFHRQKPFFNLDLYGDHTKIYNVKNQTVEENGKTYCKLNCDLDDDGWPDYNLDLNGDGIADINIVKDYKNPEMCYLNCDIDGDTIPDTNVDTNNDNVPDINITGNDYRIPEKNIDFKHNRIPLFNIETNGQLVNPINKVSDKTSCTKNCDIDGDGWPDYNIEINGHILYELINAKHDNGNNNQDNNGNNNKKGKFSIINIDVDGDGIADINVSNDGGKKVINNVNKQVGERILNKDIDNDGLPDIDIDINNDGIADVNITDGTSNVCIKNCDTNHDGTPDDLIDFHNLNKTYIKFNYINNDVNYDSICDVNCDYNFDLFPDTNIDLDGDQIPDVNIDLDNDGTADVNFYYNENGMILLNLDVNGDGICDFNCQSDGKTLNAINKKYNNIIFNQDTDKDGYPDTNVDLNNDNICDLNCDNGTNQIDKNHNYILDKDEDLFNAMLEVSQTDDNNIHIMNPIKVVASDIEPGWSAIYTLKVVNHSNYAMAYKIYWDEVKNTFSDSGHFNYYINRNYISYKPKASMPSNNLVVDNEILLKANSAMSYTMRISLDETGALQFEDSGKSFNGHLRVSVIK